MPDRAVVDDNWIFNIRVIAEGATPKEAQDLAYLTVKHPLANQNGVALMGISREKPQPRALCALSEDRQWLVVLDVKNVWNVMEKRYGQAKHGFWWKSVQEIRDTGQSADDVLREFLEGRNGQ